MRAASSRATWRGARPCSTSIRRRRPRAFAAQGFEYLHVVDLDGAFAGKPMNALAVESMLKAGHHAGAAWRRQFAISGRSRPGSTRALARVIIGTAAVRDPELVKSAAQKISRPRRGRSRCARRQGGRGRRLGRGPRRSPHSRSQSGSRDAGVAAIIFYRQSRATALLKGLNLDATIALAERISIPVIASGGFASIEDVRALLEPRAKKLAGAIAGRALYDGRLDPAAALSLIRNAARPRPRRITMFKVRVIPCLGRQGRAAWSRASIFVDLRDAGDPVEAAIAYDAGRRRRAFVFLDITATHENRGTMLDCGAGGPRESLLLCRSPSAAGVAHRRRYQGLAALRAPTRSRSTAQRSATANSSSRAPKKFGEQCIVVAIDAKRIKRSGGGERWGDLYPWRARNSTGIDAIEYAQEVVSLGAGEILADVDGSRRHPPGVRSAADGRQSPTVFPYR